MVSNASKHKYNDMCFVPVNYYSVLKKYNLRYINQSNLNDDILSDFQYTNKQLYWMGWMASDGCLSIDKNSLRIFLTTNDEEIALNFQKFSNGVIRVVKPKSENHNITYRIVAHSQDMFDFLKMAGITERKSKTLKVISQLANSPYFWRGCFEGDGCFTYQSRNNEPNSITRTVYLLTASIDFFNQLDSFFPMTTGKSYSPIFKQRYYGDNAVKISQILYNNFVDDGLYLTRKRDKAIMIVNHLVSTNRI